MRDFGKMVKMMAVAAVMAVFFCSCNVSGGSSYTSSEVSTASAAKSESGNISGGTPAASGISISFKSFGISVEYDQSRTEIASGEAVQMRCVAVEGSEAVGLCDWYVGTAKVASGESFTFSQDKPGVYTVCCIAADSAVNPLYADSVQIRIVVR